MGVLFVLLVESFRCEEQVCAHVSFKKLFVRFFCQGANPKVDEDCLVIMIKHNVVGLNVSMEQMDIVVAIVKGLKHVHRITSYLRGNQAKALYLITSAFLDADLVVILELNVSLSNLVSKASLGMILCHHIEVILFGIVYDFVKPYDIWMFETLKHLQLLLDTIVSCLL